MILKLFMSHLNRVFSRCEIVDKLWEIDKVIVASDRTVRTYITNLRHKLKDAAMLTDCLETLYGFGYRLGSEHN